MDNRSYDLLWRAQQVHTPVVSKTEVSGSLSITARTAPMPMATP
jgi:hypothetical protein